ncbi:DUF2849 domain-containing protein [Vannielia sp.]|uniref:DUF2849 domain-containing protein n=1 Tax=Vannielia sp. TaxID=2813045 RepID=UPI0026151DC0|nr:DUF2849 domain-containing protein [Vannielia sp.]MDF1873092.1 DUF2849 domain-containing protein [Vannielia sp.]
MSRAFTPKVVTANALIEGDVVYLTATGEWTRRHDQARLFTEQQAAEAALSAASLQVADVVGVYLADATEGATGPQPDHFRERFRATGPSNYAHGKQVDL